MKDFFGFGGYTREPEGFLSWQHLLFVGVGLVIMALCAVLIGRSYRDGTEKRQASDCPFPVSLCSRYGYTQECFGKGAIGKNSHLQSFYEILARGILLFR